MKMERLRWVRSLFDVEKLMGGNGGNTYGGGWVGRSGVRGGSDVD